MAEKLLSNEVTESEPVAALGAEVAGSVDWVAAGDGVAADEEQPTTIAPTEAIETATFANLNNPCSVSA
jgi:hypothetical protein